MGVPGLVLLVRLAGVNALAGSASQVLRALFEYP